MVVALPAPDEPVEPAVVGDAGEAERGERDVLVLFVGHHGLELTLHGREQDVRRVLAALGHDRLEASDRRADRRGLRDARRAHDQDHALGAGHVLEVVAALERGAVGALLVGLDRRLLDREVDAARADGRADHLPAGDLGLGGDDLGELLGTEDSRHEVRGVESHSSSSDLIGVGFARPPHPPWTRIPSLATSPLLWSERPRTGKLKVKPLSPKRHRADQSPFEWGLWRPTLPWLV